MPSGNPGTGLALPSKPRRWWPSRHLRSKVASYLPPPRVGGVLKPASDMKGPGNMNGGWAGLGVPPPGHSSDQRATRRRARRTEAWGIAGANDPVFPRDLLCHERVARSAYFCADGCGITAAQV